MLGISNWQGNEVGILTPYHRKVALKLPGDSGTKESNDFGCLLYNISI